jgi:hypothetical protein
MTWLVSVRVPLRLKPIISSLGNALVRWSYVRSG